MNTIHLQASRVISLPGPPGGRLKNVTAPISLTLERLTFYYILLLYKSIYIYNSNSENGRNTKA